METIQKETNEMTKWAIDKTHSEIQFKVKHLMITTVTGSFKEFEGEVSMNGTDLTTLKAKFSADINSITTANEQRDAHLKGDDFFSADKFPKLTFVSDGVVKKSDTDYIVTGNLTIRDVTKPVSLNVELGGIAKDPWGNTKIGLNFHSKINRKDFGLKFHVVNEAGDLLVHDEIKVLGEIELSKA